MIAVLVPLPREEVSNGHFGFHSFLLAQAINSFGIFYMVRKNQSSISDKLIPNHACGNCGLIIAYVTKNYREHQ